jgi:hypothetical protein
MLSLSDPQFLFCERTGAGLLNEPLNVMSSAAFLVAAWLLWLDYRKTRTNYDEERLTLIVLLTLTGLGGMFLHTTANRLGVYAQLLPLGLFLAVVLYVTIQRLLGIGVKPVLLLVLGLAAVCGLTRSIPDPYRFHDVVAWFPILGALMLITWRLRRMRHAAARDFLKITGLIALSMTLRFTDWAVCYWLPAGTYFLAEICTGMALYLMARTIRERRHAPRS